VDARMIAKDTTNDLALLKVDVNSSHVASLRFAVRLGENVEAFGYPLSQVLATTGNFTTGNVTALAGIGDDSRYIQISAPIQPGNSGGPLLDRKWKSGWHCYFQIECHCSPQKCWRHSAECKLCH